MKSIKLISLFFSMMLLSVSSQSNDDISGTICNILDTPGENLRWSIHRYDLDSNTSQLVFGVKKNRTIQSVACRSEADPIVFSMRETTGGDFELYEYDSTRATPLKQLTNNDTDDVDVTISSDGKVMAYQRRLTDGRQAISLSISDDYWKYPALTLASVNPFVQPALSENGQWMVFVQLRPGYFALMRYDIALKKYTEIRKVLRRKKLYHPSISNDGNIVGWSENRLKNRYLVKNIEEDVITEVVNNIAGIEHGVLSSDGKKVLYSINDGATSQLLVTAVDTLDTEQVGVTLAAPMRALGTAWHAVAEKDSTTFDLLSSSLVSNAERFPGSSNRITLTFDKEVDSESVSNGIFIKNNTTGEIFSSGITDFDAGIFPKLSWGFYKDYIYTGELVGAINCAFFGRDECIQVTDNAIINLSTSFADLDSGEYSLFVTTDLQSNESGNALQRNHEYKFSIDKRQSFYAASTGVGLTGLFGSSRDLGANEAELGFNIYNDVKATELFYKVTLSNGEEREGSFDIGSADVSTGGQSDWGYQICSFAVVVQSRSSSYIENEMNYRKVSVGIINDTNKDFKGTANVELCSDTGECQSFDFDLEVDADPDFEAIPSLPVCMALVD